MAVNSNTPDHELRSGSGYLHRDVSPNAWNKTMAKKKMNCSLKRTLYGTGICMVLWAMLVGIMLTNPQIKSTNPGVYEVVQLLVPWTDPETGERSGRRLMLPL